ncbi:serine hydrolase [Erythrobacter sp. YT30]|uniref:serine hydrolase domain-containing protein n=1 Tax=Erythrobacter sp. YT30 TaxID=1735012 RepID=UPI00076BC5CC|nr:serine hydrolase domain-containing protein [Erythrobacter sp. YT30]KWV90887.1 hypothetical protein AUC45_05965 [Erythrobacter sp. YT30]
MNRITAIPRLFLGFCFFGYFIGFSFTGDSGTPALAIEPCAALTQLAETTAKDGEVPGIIILFERGDASYLIAEGTTMRDGGEPLTGEETLRLGSITKTYMAALTLELSREGMINLDAPISELLPSSVLARLPANLDPNVRQLLGHQSGIPDYYSRRFYLKDWDRTAPLTPDVALHSIRGVKRTMNPGTRFDYSNTNYQVLALILEQATGKTIDALIEDRLLKRFGLAETYYSVASPPGDVIHGYGSPIDTWEPTFALRENSGPDGGMFASADDAAKWIRTLFASDGALREIGDQMIADTAPESTRKRQGLGVEIFQSRSGDKVFGHTGSLDGYMSGAFYVPKTDTTIVIHMSRSDDQAFSALLSGTFTLAIAQDLE